MQRAYVREELDASIEAAWDCLRDFADISAWARGRVVTTEGTGVGMIRHVDTSNGRAVERPPRAEALHRPGPGRDCAKNRHARADM